MSDQVDMKAQSELVGRLGGGQNTREWTEQYRRQMEGMQNTPKPFDRQDAQKLLELLPHYEMSTMGGFPHMRPAAQGGYIRVEDAISAMKHGVL